jgi:EmrB/QacA subfamily drug resistance transporter
MVSSVRKLTEPIAPSDRRRWLALAVLCLSLVVVTIDTTILNVALPTLVDSLHASSSALQWIVDGYTVVFAGLLLTAGSVGDRFGRRGALSVGLAIFGAASAASALAANTTQLIGLRALTGVGAALVFPATLSIIANVFPDPRERQRAIAVWAGTAGIGIGLGPVAGGLLLRWFSWGSVFWVNVPVCLLALVAGRAFVPTSKDPGESPLDGFGAALSIVGLSALVYAIIEGPSLGWSSRAVTTGFAVAAIAIGSFVVAELRSPHPMLDLRLFANARFSAASLAMTALYFCLFGTIFFQTQHLQFVLGYDPLGAGLRSLPFAFVLIVVANTTPRIVDRIGTRAVVTLGLLIVAAAMAGRVGFTVHTTYTGILLTQCLFALGMGLTIAPATASIMGAVSSARAGVGSAINDTTRQVGGALGVAVMGSVGASLYRHAISGSAAAAHLPSRALDSVGSTLAASTGLPAAARVASVDAARHAFIHGLDVASLVAVVIALVGAAIAARFLPAPERATESVVGVLPVDGDPVRDLWVTLEPTAREGAEWNDRPAVLSGLVDRGSDEKAGDPASFQRVGNTGVHEHEALAGAVVHQLGEVSVDLELEP